MARSILILGLTEWNPGHHEIILICEGHPSGFVVNGESNRPTRRCIFRFGMGSEMPEELRSIVELQAPSKSVTSDASESPWVAAVGLNLEVNHID